MKGFNSLIILLFLSSNLYSTNYTFNGSSSAIWEDTGNWDVYPGLSVAEGDTVFIDSDCMLSYEIYELYGDIVINAGAQLSSCATLEIYGKITVYGTLFSDGYTSLDETGIIENEGTLTGFGYFTSGEIINNANALTFSVDDFNGQIVNNAYMELDVYVGGVGLLHNTSTGVMLMGSFDNQGEIINDGEIQGGWIENDGDIINNGTMENINVYAWFNGTVENNDFISAEFLELHVGSVSNSGTLEVSELFLIGEEADLDNSGTINTLYYDNYGISINTGNITMTGGGNNGFEDEYGYPSYIINDGLIHNFGDYYNNDTIYNNLDLVNDGTIYGSGIIIGNIVIDGNMAPGNSPGIFTVQGDYTQTSTANLMIEIDGPATGTAGVDFDQVNVSGNADLAGTVEVILNGPEPNIGDAYPIIVYGSLEPGSILILDAPVLSGGKTWALQYNTDGILLIVDGALPVKLTSFTVSLVRETAELQWKTASEVNNAGFEIERSEDTNKWENIGFVSGAGTTLATKEYTYTDPKPLVGKSYYRLKQLDTDGKFSYSFILSIDRQRGLKVFPNPSTNYIILESGGVEKFSIINQDGRTIIEGMNNAGRIDVSILPRGSYFVKVGKELIQFVKT